MWFKSLLKMKVTKFTVLSWVFIFELLPLNWSLPYRMCVSCSFWIFFAYLFQLFLLLLLKHRLLLANSCNTRFSMDNLILMVEISHEKFSTIVQPYDFEFSVDWMSLKKYCNSNWVSYLCFIRKTYVIWV